MPLSNIRHLPLIFYLKILSALFDNPVHLLAVRAIQRTIPYTDYSLFIFPIGQCFHIFEKQGIRLTILRLYTKTKNGSCKKQSDS